MNNRLTVIVMCFVPLALIHGCTASQRQTAQTVIDAKRQICIHFAEDEKRKDVCSAAADFADALLKLKGDEPEDGQSDAGSD